MSTRKLYERLFHSKGDIKYRTPEGLILIKDGTKWQQFDDGTFGFEAKIIEPPGKERLEFSLPISL